jgi:hypothetical protein
MRGIKTIRNGDERKAHESLDSRAIERLVQRGDRPVSSRPKGFDQAAPSHDRTIITAWANLNATYFQLRTLERDRLGQIAPCKA